MSGRLTISTKKTYCPWSAENEAKYQIAEEKQKQARQEEEKKIEHTCSRSQWDQLRNQQKTEPSSEGHVNLFPPPAVPDDSESRHSSSGTRLTNKNDNQPFYLSSKSTLGNEPENKSFHQVEKERAKRDRLDPMSSFHTEANESEMGEKRPRPSEDAASKRDSLKRRKSRSREDISSDSNSSISSSRSERKRRKKKHRKKERRRERRYEKQNKRRRKDQEFSTETKTSSTTNISELREKRLKREREEQQRQAQLQHGFRASTGYNDQFRKHI